MADYKQPREAGAASGKPIETSLMDRVKQGLGYIMTGNTGWFPPLEPMRPVAPDTAARQFDFPAGINLRIPPKSPDTAVTFLDLRNLADGYDLLRAVIETRKDQVESYKWDIKAKEGKSVSTSLIEDATHFFKRPDGMNLWSQWLRMALEELFVIDALVIYPRMRRGGGLYSIELVDGATIRRVIDYYGRTPLPEDGPAYQQVLKGMATSNFRANELCYFMRNPRVHKLYGYSPVEQIMMTVNIALRRQTHILQYYTEGNIPEALVAVPETWTADQIKQFQIYWDSIIAGDTAVRRRMRFIPKMDVEYTKTDDTLKSEFDEWLARIICYVFSVSPTMLTASANRATAQQVAESAKQEGLIPLLNTLKSWFDHILQDWYGLEDAEFRWDAQNKLSPTDQATVDTQYVSAGIWTPDEVREEQGKGPLPKPPTPAPGGDPVIDPETGEPKIDPLTGKPVLKQPMPPGMNPATGAAPPQFGTKQPPAAVSASASEVGSEKDKDTEQ